jgi:CheY-like chemotaxis protein
MSDRTRTLRRTIESGSIKMVQSYKHLDVLIVDDEPFMRKTLSQMLKVLGVSVVREAGNGTEALQELISLPESKRPNLLICDISMDKMGGIELLERLRGHQDFDLAGMPVIVATAHSDMETVRRAVDRYISGYLVKPFKTPQLKARIDQCLADLPARESLSGRGSRIA